MSIQGQNKKVHIQNIQTVRKINKNIPMIMKKDHYHSYHNDNNNKNRTKNNQNNHNKPTIKRL